MYIYSYVMDKLQLTQLKLRRIFNSTFGYKNTLLLCWFEAILPSSKLKTRPKQALGYLPFDIALSCYI